MARPKIERGADWFRHSVTAGTRGAYAAVIDECGALGYGVLNLLLETIYGDCGYYMAADPKAVRSFSRRVALTEVEKVEQVIEVCLSEGIFCRELFDRYQILTSAEIQSDYFSIVSKRASIDVNPDYLLVEAPRQSSERQSTAETKVSDAETFVSDAETLVSDAIIPQSKSKSKSKSKRESNPVAPDNIINYSSFHPKDGTEGKTPNYETVMSHASDVGISREIAGTWYKTMERQCWCDRNGQLIRSWRASLQRYAQTAVRRNSELTKRQQTADETEDELYRRVREQYLRERDEAI